MVVNVNYYLEFYQGGIDTISRAWILARRDRGSKVLSDLVIESKRTKSSNLNCLSQNGLQSSVSQHKGFGFIVAILNRVGYCHFDIKGS